MKQKQKNAATGNPLRKWYWKESSKFRSIPAEIAGEHLEKIRAKNGGYLRPINVLSDARSEKSPLHNVFEWDDSAAGEKYRLQQASEILRSIEKIEVRVINGKDRDFRERAYLSVPVENADSKRVYMEAIEVMQSPRRREDFLREALNLAEQWRRNYERYVEFAKICEAIEITKKRVG